MRRISGPVLIIEDDEDIRELLKVLLEAEGLPVTVATDGRDARERLRTGAPPALILLDWMMPNIDGEQFLTELRASQFSETPVIVLSGNDAAQEKARALQAYCLKKPVEFDELWHAVSRSVSLPPKRDVA